MSKTKLLCAADESMWKSIFVMSDLVVNRRMFKKLLDIMDNASQPLHSTR